MTYNILVVGAGAIGAFYGSRLAQGKDVEVSVVCRSNYDAVKQNGFHVESPYYGKYDWKPTNVYRSSKEAQGKQWHYLIVTTKSLPDVSDDSALLEGVVGEGTAIVLIQNGLGIEAPYVRRFPHASILSAITIASAAQPSHGHIQHNRWTRIQSGGYFGDSVPKNFTPSQQATLDLNETFIGLLKDGGGIKDASAYSPSKMLLLRWHKIAINASMNPSAVLSGGTPNGTMANDPELATHLRGVMDEVLETAPKIVGSPFPADFATAETLIKSTQKNTSGSKPSMLLDWEEGKTMELEVILGNPIRIARQQGYEMPRMQTLYALLKMAQRQRDEQVKKTKESKL